MVVILKKLGSLLAIAQHFHPIIGFLLDPKTQLKAILTGISTSLAHNGSGFTRGYEGSAVEIPRLVKMLNKITAPTWQI
jgi:hypothetical protein